MTLFIPSTVAKTLRSFTLALRSLDFVASMQPVMEKLSQLTGETVNLAVPDGGLLIGVLDGAPVTGGAFRRFDAQTAELKRIWTDRAHRRRGYARALLAALEAETATRGYRRLYLITGNRQPEAEALYDATGGYDVAFLAMLVSAVVALALTLMLRRKAVHS